MNGALDLQLGGLGFPVTLGKSPYPSVSPTLGYLFRPVVFNLLALWAKCRASPQARSDPMLQGWVQIPRSRPCCSHPVLCGRTGVLGPRATSSWPHVLGWRSQDPVPSPLGSARQDWAPGPLTASAQPHALRLGPTSLCMPDL